MIVFTNGCFDVCLHAAHVDFLRQCRAMGDSLLVGLNSDASVRCLKGPTRPICPQEDRKRVLEACRWVDQVFIFDELTPCALIERWRPDIICKGPGYSDENMPEARIVREFGGKVVILPGIAVSSTKIIQTILERSGK